MRYFSWQPFRRDGNLGQWTKTHIIKDERTLCGLKVPRKLDVFDYSSEGFAGDGCKKCWSKRPLVQKQKEIKMTDRKQQLEQLQSLTNAIGTVLQEPGSDLKKLDGIAGLLEGTHTDEGMLALIMISVFKAGKVVGANEFKQRIASL